ncbi:response regulator transcription factor [Aliarcobacter skirrowii]|jgi:DNA-binding response OmpR family regulator|uniref:DNA-binding response regulator n=2 Tax=Aliarcobacter skirrowii TaxID=28200 RepID=A0AAD0SM28_9BACT|nr:response regulator transcription factor [Aliarcobacter skirrowii]AXX85070.1 two-component system response regulator [Aliarcobacter skirrowii CCUG 10374]KAB0620768.1 response regulator transcription factor [Aliarcobacter skirrowii CCUG 10374]MDD3025178.1 response regulator transcription factor [Aliarcobacter skirrowii]MDX3959877.1 response regulator transcription factor [Aliarcobacter skirrowii]MDX4061631.1 response regulator transcription factor [Aliarcobacter skirrowii]
MYNILILEDDSLFASSIEDFLNCENFEVDIAKDSEEVFSYTYSKNYDLYLFDINVPKLNGLETLKMLRQSNDNTPCIFLTSYKDKDTLKSGFISGCDDYIKKPVDLDELNLRLRAILRRENKGFSKVILEDNLYFNQEDKRVYKDNEDLNLPSKVLELLELFIENRNKIVTKEMIFSRLYSKEQTHSEGAVRVYINQIKNIFETKDDVIKNIKGVGYKFEL